MRSRQIVATTFVVLLSAVVGIGLASAQVTTSSDKSFQPQVIETTFRFEVGGKTMPAGKYEVDLEAPDVLVFRPTTGKGPVIEAPVLTRLAQPLTPIPRPEVVFDKVNDSYFISEVWLPGQDGYLLGGIKEKHTHERVKTTRKLP